MFGGSVFIEIIQTPKYLNSYPQFLFNFILFTKRSCVVSKLFGTK